VLDAREASYGLVREARGISPSRVSAFTRRSVSRGAAESRCQVELVEMPHCEIGRRSASRANPRANENEQGGGAITCQFEVS
jgi:hypothetical protein